MLKFRSRTAVIVKKKKPTTTMPKMAIGMTGRVGHRDRSSVGWGTDPPDISATTSPNPWRCSLSQRTMFSSNKAMVKSSKPSPRIISGSMVVPRMPCTLKAVSLLGPSNCLPKTQAINLEWLRASGVARAITTNPAMPS